jgi:hypothetical protein
VFIYEGCGKRRSRSGGTSTNSPVGNDDASLSSTKKVLKTPFSSDKTNLMDLLPNFIIEKVYDMLNIIDRTRFNEFLSACSRVQSTASTTAKIDARVLPLFLAVREICELDPTQAVACVQELAPLLKPNDPTREDLRDLLLNSTDGEENEIAPYDPSIPLLQRCADATQRKLERPADHPSDRNRNYFAWLVRKIHSDDFDTCNDIGVKFTPTEFDEFVEAVRDSQETMQPSSFLPIKAYRTIVFGMVNYGNVSLLRHVTASPSYASTTLSVLRELVTRDSGYYTVNTRFFDILRENVDVPASYMADGLKNNVRKIIHSLDHEKENDIFDPIKSAYANLNNWSSRVDEYHERHRRLQLQ